MDVASKHRICIRTQSATQWQVNHLRVCKFAPWKMGQFADSINHITGWDVTLQELTATVDRGVTLTRIFNIREGDTKEDDVLPRRFNETPANSPLKGIDSEQFSRSRGEFYQLQGWDEDGIPRKATLKRLGIEWAAARLS